MSSIKVVQAFTREDDEHRRFMGASRQSLRATLRLYSWQTLYSGAVNAVIAGGTALVVYAGARAVLSGALTVGQLIVFISYLAQLYAPINQITQSWGLIAGARVGRPPGVRGARHRARPRRRQPQLSAAGRAAARSPGAASTSAIARETPVLTGIDLAVAARRQDRHRRRDRGRQIDLARPAAALFRSDRRRGRDRRRRRARIPA